MARYFKSINKKSVQIDVFHGWDIKLKQWFVDVKMFLPAWRCSMSVGDFLSMTSRLECSTQVYLSCIFDLKHLCYHV